VDAHVRAAYGAYAFQDVTRVVSEFCASDLSQLYFDVRRDVLYCDRPDSVRRRAARTVMAEVFSFLTAWLAPITCFTAEEAWWHLPHRSSETIHLESFPEADETVEDEALHRRWETILALRSEVARALEGARQAKIIGHPLDAVVKLALPEELRDAFAGQEDVLRSVFIVSQVVFSPAADLLNPLTGLEMTGLQVQVAPASGNKCERCWVRSEKVGLFLDHPTICDRCYGVVAK